MEILKQNLSDANANAKEIFEIKARIIFNGAQSQEPLKTLLKNEELLFRKTFVERKLNAVQPEQMLIDLGIDDELAMIDNTN